MAGPLSVEIRGIHYDSRQVEPGSLFVCIRGFRQDGHAFISDAVARGAVAVLMEADPGTSTVPAGVTAVRVPDARAALAQVATRFFRYPSRALRLVGITGTNGKTTTAYLVEAILTAAGRKTGLLGTI